MYGMNSMTEKHEHGNAETAIQPHENKLVGSDLPVVTRPELGPGVCLDLNGAVALFPFSDDDTD
jgi:hypothetical protein